MDPTLRQMHEELSVGEEFVQRYNRPGPRYTSYPTAPVWTDSFGPADYEAAMADADRKRVPVALYMHLLLCETLSHICACYVIIRKHKRGKTLYLVIIKKE